MKKSVLWGIIALATATMSSCSNDEPVEALQQNNAIEFGTYLGRDAQGRGVVLDGTNLANFGVFASYSGQNYWTIESPMNFMFDQEVEKDATGWKYSPKKYWPTTENDKITFFAYAPFTADATSGLVRSSVMSDAGIPKMMYSISSDSLLKQADFTADVLYNKIKEDDGTSIDSKDRTVEFNLKHELTRLNFSAKIDANLALKLDGKTNINIKSITFQAGGEFYTKAEYTFRTPEKVRGTWKPLETGALNIAELLNTANASGFGTYTENGILVPSTDVVPLLKTNEYLFLIPTDLEGLAAAGNVKIEVAYDIVTKDDKLNGGYSVTPATKIISFPEKTLKQGVAYNFLLTFGLNEIKLSATVAAWNDPEEGFNGNVDWPKDDVTNP